jgi:hypothetical protein
MLEFLLDGQAVTEPEGLTQLRHRIYFNTGLNGYLEQFDGSVMFYGDEYKYLRNRLFVDGCAISEVVIRNGIDTYRGNIFLNDAEWEPDLCKVTCEIVDASFLSLIDNNKDIKAYLNVPRSKNDVDISSFTVTQSNLLCKAATTTDADTPANRYGVRLYDAFKFLIAFMSDGQIGFVSDYFLPETSPTNATETRNPTLLTGYSLRLGEQVNPDDNQWPYLSFEELYTDAQRLYNLSFSMETVSGVPTMRIEPRAYYQASGQSLTLPYAKGIKQTADRDSYYQLMKFGSANADDETFTYYPEELLQSWKEEEYHLGGQCNTSVILDLQTKTVVTDCNTIMTALPISAGGQDEDSTDDEIFLLVFDGNNETIINTHPVTPTRVYYNNRLTNLAVANRWGDGVPFPIFLFLGANNNQARAFNQTDAILDRCDFATSLFSTSFYAFAEFPVTVPPFGFDPNTNIVQGTIQETCVTPINATYYQVPITGVYTVNARVIFSTDGLRSSGGNVIGAEIVHYDSADVFQPDQVSIGFTNTNPNAFFVTFEGSATFSAQAGDKLAIRFNGVDTGAGIHNITLHNGSFMDIPGRGLITKTYNPADNYLLKSSVNCPIPADWWRSFRNNWHQLITMTYNTGQSSGYVNEVNRNILTGDADVDIVSKFADVTR